MLNLKQFAKQLVDLNVEEVKELSKLLVENYDFGTVPNYVFCGYESKHKYFVPKTINFKSRNNSYFINNKRFFLLRHQKTS